VAEQAIKVGGDVRTRELVWIGVDVIAKRKTHFDQKFAQVTWTLPAVLVQLCPAVQKFELRGAKWRTGVEVSGPFPTSALFFAMLLAISNLNTEHSLKLFVFRIQPFHLCTQSKGQTDRGVRI
jgi:hypothetical protein